jgi:hypothetical protein
LNLPPPSLSLSIVSSPRLSLHPSLSTLPLSSFVLSVHYCNEYGVLINVKEKESNNFGWFLVMKSMNERERIKI